MKNAERRYKEAFNDLTWYNGLAEEVVKWKDWPGKEDHVSVPHNYGYDGADWQTYFQLQVIWIIAVSLFGDWGVSPRVGWIEDVKGFHKWIDDITEDWRETYDSETDE
jgi:hypothetical protein